MMPQYQRQMAQMNQDAATVAPTQPQVQLPPMIPQQNYIKGRPVVSIDEARASQIDLDGSLYVFPDLGNKKIYTKQINLDGTATFNVFELKAEEAPAEGPAYVTKDELDHILEQFKASLTLPKATQTQVAAPLNFNL